MSKPTEADIRESIAKGKRRGRRQRSARQRNFVVSEDWADGMYDRHDAEEAARMRDDEDKQEENNER